MALLNAHAPTALEAKTNPASQHHEKEDRRHGIVAPTRKVHATSYTIPGDAIRAARVEAPRIGTHCPRARGLGRCRGNADSGRR